jgi:nitroreductase
LPCARLTTWGCTRSASSRSPRRSVRRGLDDTEVAAARRRAHNGPALLAVIGRLREDVDDVPLHEQWMCIGGAVMNLLNALHLLGYGARVVSGSSVRDAEVRDAFCAPGEVLVAWVIAGTPTRSTHARHDERVDDLLTEWPDIEP